MAGGYKDEVPMLSDTFSPQSDESNDTGLQRFSTRSTTRSASMSLPRNIGSYEYENSLVSHTGPLRDPKRTLFVPMSGPINMNSQTENPFRSMHRLLGTKGSAVTAEELSSTDGMGQDWPKGNYVAKNEHLLKSGPLGRCNDPYCTTCPSYYTQPTRQKKYRASTAFETKFHNAIYGDAKGWLRRSISSIHVPIMNPHAKAVQQWNKFFVISCLVAIFIDPLFFFLLSVEEKNKCIVLHWSLANGLAAVRSVTDFIYLLHMVLQLRLAYVAPESRVVGAGDLVDDPKKVALHYVCGYYFILDLFVVLPLPQIMILLVLPKYLGSSAANYAKNLLRVTVLLQYIPRITRFLPLLAGQSASGFIFESAWANFVLNLLMFVLAGHVVGSCWYLFGLQRVNQCLREACTNSSMSDCKRFIDCGHGNNIDKFRENKNWSAWQNQEKAEACFSTDSKTFAYGIYVQAVGITTQRSIAKRYIYSLFWGFQQISTLAGNQIPSSFVWEVLFTMGIIGLGLFLFALLIGNMQNFLQSLGRRRLEMQLRRRDVEQWMSHRRLPEELRRQVRQSERFTWAATRGVNEELLMEKLPEDLQREIRRHLFKFVRKVRIFTLMDEPILDAICQRLRQKLYIGGSKILYRGGPIDKMVFIVRGKMESIGADGHVVPLSEGDVCGEELLTWCLEQSGVNKECRKIRYSSQRLLSNRTALCISNVEAFSLRATDLDEVTALFARFLRNPRVKGAIRYESPYWRELAATRIQVAWRYRQKRLNRTDSSSHQPTHQGRY
ncbi:probable cyclic nucleotide-gated ion channel 20, chloroplastic [Aristolochia californica]|uniref:probable cyclic nucleotide-gated ion channel 20, chloroplastic n=1 Tax=Aristolochia californica TaxID=171875 RepID=UPI0035E2E47E